MLNDQTGKNIPNIFFKIREDNKWITINSNQIFQNKKIVLFSLPGAFTPTCSSKHLPEYEKYAEDIKNQGVDDIYCLSVNDTFVMNAWALNQKISKVKMLPDGNGDFSKAMNMLVDKKDLGFGMRSWRYSMLVINTKIYKMFIEKFEPNDPFKVSDAITMLEYLKLLK